MNLDKALKDARAKGLHEGLMSGIKRTQVDFARCKFGVDAADRLSNVLASHDDPDRLALLSAY